MYKKFVLIVIAIMLSITALAGCAEKPLSPVELLAKSSENMEMIKSYTMKSTTTVSGNISVGEENIALNMNLVQDAKCLINGKNTLLYVKTASDIMGESSVTEVYCQGADGIAKMYTNTGSGWSFNTEDASDVFAALKGIESDVVDKGEEMFNGVKSVKLELSMPEEAMESMLSAMGQSFEGMGDVDFSSLKMYVYVDKDAKTIIGITCDLNDIMKQVFQAIFAAMVPGVDVETTIEGALLTCEYSGFGKVEAFTIPDEALAAE